MLKIIEHDLIQGPDFFELLSKLHKQTFTTEFTADKWETLCNRDNKIVLSAHIDDEPAGYKIGYTLPEDPLTLYSWIGGVLPEFRRRGIAERLMNYQHVRARDMGLSGVETKSYPRWAAMMELNYKVGFKLLREYTCKKRGETKYHLRKEL